MIMKKQIDLHIEGIYGWGIGYYSHSHANAFNGAVDTFIRAENLSDEITQEVGNGKCCTVGKFNSDNYIYFHAMHVVFVGKYAEKSSIEKFKAILEDYIPCTFKLQD
jgi:hypothetical protein